MTWPPVSSEDTRELRAAEAEESAALDARPRHGRDCVDGWLGDDEHDRPIPCLECRPHLTRRRGDVST